MYQRCFSHRTPISVRWCVTAWKATGQPTVRKQRDKRVVRVDGIDTATGNHRPRQLGTYPSQRSANAAARSMKTEDRSTERGTGSWLVRRYVASRTDITVKDANAQLLDVAWT